MKFLSKLASAGTLLALLSAPAFASVIQTSGPGTFNSTNSWVQGELGRVVLATGTSVITALNTTETLIDQGKGASSPGANQVYVGLFQGETNYYGVHTGGATHTLTTFSYDLLPSELNSLNTALQALNYATGPITLRFMAAPVGNTGWQLHVTNAYMTVTSNEPVVAPSAGAPVNIPEPAPLALLGAGLGVCAFVSRRNTPLRGSRTA